MKKLDWTAVTASNGLVFEEQTFEHMNNGHKDSYIAFVKANIPSAWHTGKLVILYGCVATGTNPGIRTLTEGAVYYNGEIYQVSSASFTTVNPQIGVWTLVDVDSGTDESTIKTATSSFLSHVLVNSKFVFTAGESGSGTFDEGSLNVVHISSANVSENIDDASSDTLTGTYTLLSGSSYTLPNDGVYRRFFIQFKGLLLQKTETSTTSTCKVRIKNNTTGDVYDETIDTQAISGLATGADYLSTQKTIQCFCIENIQCNGDVIQVQGIRTASSSFNCTIIESRLMVIQLD